MHKKLYKINEKIKYLIKKTGLLITTKIGITLNYKSNCTIPYFLFLLSILYSKYALSQVIIDLMQ